MKKRSMIVAAALTLTSLVSMSSPSTTVFAADSECKGDAGFGISNIPLEQQLEDFLNDPDLTEAQKEAAAQKVQEAIAFRDSESCSSVYSTARATYPTKTISVPAYTQENKYYCGPATTRQTLGYLGMILPGTYTPPSQSTIASAIGTTSNGTEWYRITQYINSFNFNGYKPNYIEYHPSTQSNMEGIIYTALNRTNPTPPILQISTKGLESKLGYPTNGHYMNVSGITTKNGVVYFQITDPNRQRVTDEKGNKLSAKYEIPASEIYKYTQNHWAQHFMY